MVGLGRVFIFFLFCLGCVHAIGFFYLCYFNVALILLWEGGGFIIDRMEMDMDMEMEMENENRILLQSRLLTRIASAPLFFPVRLPSVTPGPRITRHNQHNRAQPPIAPTHPSTRHSTTTPPPTATTFTLNTPR